MGTQRVVDANAKYLDVSRESIIRIRKGWNEFGAVTNTAVLMWECVMVKNCSEKDALVIANLFIDDRCTEPDQSYYDYHTATLYLYISNQEVSRVTRALIYGYFRGKQSR